MPVFLLRVELTRASTLMCQIVLTHLLRVVRQHCLAFVFGSMIMFGMTASTLRFSRGLTPSRMRNSNGDIPNALVAGTVCYILACMPL
jgi:hypothetical protein